MSDDEQVRRVQAWVNGYIQAWNSNDPAAIGSLFSEDGAYYTEPLQPTVAWARRDRPAMVGSQGRAGRDGVPLAPAHRKHGGGGCAG